ncbi:MAG: UDP-N-acetylmuramoyl-L-alanyl-D-glutamate--2,6-diaminopimelate ligase [Candidatus Nealsonbacteria bacterium]|nr:UDP-N-acetylmuramoyl-L-alanyl-D-glutamate--2,6-diaminopimelate ligase [Candidatus Nealsonbacteria bacterium]
MKKIIRKIAPNFLINFYHFGLAFLGAVLYFFPSRKMKIIGVTGTNGKSTVVYLISKILEEAGFSVGSVSTIKFKIKDREWLNTLKMTMPGRFKLQKFLRQALNQGCQYVVVEVSSEGLLQSRHKFIDFDAAIFTNLTPEHIETHGSFEKYREAKGKLFKSLRGSKKSKTTSIINLDDPNADYFLKFEADRKIGYGLNSEPTDKVSNFLKAIKTEATDQGLKFVLADTTFNLKLRGVFNIYNSLSAIASALSQGIDLKTCKRALEKIEVVSGRMEEVISSPFKVFVDYAHTPDALSKAYSALPKDSLKICVLGSCGGGRDKWKRPKMGEIASQFCNQIILTNEDPYDDNPVQIIKEIASGIQNQSIGLTEILDRREAIKQALALAKKGDTVIITGKGSEPWMCVAGAKKIPWDDREIAREEFKKLTLR